MILFSSVLRSFSLSLSHTHSSFFFFTLLVGVVEEKEEGSMFACERENDLLHGECYHHFTPVSYKTLADEKR